jgi:hypothetical protein
MTLGATKVATPSAMQSTTSGARALLPLLHLLVVACISSDVFVKAFTVVATSLPPCVLMQSSVVQHSSVSSRCSYMSCCAASGNTLNSVPVCSVCKAGQAVHDAYSQCLQSIAKAYT